MVRRKPVGSDSMLTCLKHLDSVLELSVEPVPDSLVDSTVTEEHQSENAEDEYPEADNSTRNALSADNDNR